MTLSLAAVFIPVLFMGGIVGRLLHEFAVTIGVGDPRLGLRVAHADADAVQPLPASRRTRMRHGRLYNAIERVFDALAARLRLDAAADASASRRVTMVVSALLLGGTVYLFRIIPKGFIPSQDTGQHQRPDRGDRRASASTRWSRTRSRWPTSSSADPNVASFTSNVGGRRRQQPAACSIDLKPRAERTLTADQVIEELRPKLARDPGRPRVPENPPVDPHRRPCRRARQYQFTLQDGDTDELYDASRRSSKQRAARRCPGLDGRLERPAAHQPAGERHARSRADRGARPDGRSGRGRAGQRVRLAAGRRRSSRRTTSTR